MALRLRFPGAKLLAHLTDHGNGLMIEHREDNGSIHLYSTPPNQNFRQHDVRWLTHRFAALLAPVIAGGQLRDTLEKARSED